MKIGLTDLSGGLAWSFDSKKLAYVSIETIRSQNDPARLLVLDVNSDNQSILMEVFRSDYMGMYKMPAWSYNNQQIAMLSYVALYQEDSLLTGDAVFVMNADGTNLRRVTEPSRFILHNLQWRAFAHN